MTGQVGCKYFHAGRTTDIGGFYPAIAAGRHARNNDWHGGHFKPAIDMMFEHIKKATPVDIENTLIGFFRVENICVAIYQKRSE